MDANAIRQAQICAGEDAVTRDLQAKGLIPAPAQPALDGDRIYWQRLCVILDAVQRYLPPGGISAQDLITEVIAQVDPWPGPWDWRATIKAESAAAGVAPSGQTHITWDAQGRRLVNGVPADDGVALPVVGCRTVKIEDGELVEFDVDQPDGEFYLVPITDGQQAAQQSGGGK